ncbi:MAG TPA: transporter [Rhizobium sp.]|nr:transporter [Rhizobium sp.]
MVFKPQRFHGEEPVIEAEYPNHESLETAVARCLSSADGVDTSDMSVTVARCEVFLSGNVMWAEEVDRAVDVALSVPGVEKVTVNLRIGARGTG